jgi:hypothetical protein
MNGRSANLGGFLEVSRWRLTLRIRGPKSKESKSGNPAQDIECRDKVKIIDQSLRLQWTR